MIDIKALLDSYGVHYVVSGANVAKGNINVKCPWCGNADKSEHMGIKLSNGVWGCWRSKAHRGTNLAYLLQKLLGVSKAQAIKLAGGKVEENAHFDDYVLEEVAQGDFLKDNEQLQSRRLRSILLPREFRRLPDDRKTATRFLNYLEMRGFDQPGTLAYEYDMYYAVTGDYKWRVILPVRLDGVMVAFTSRAIGNAKVRYKSIPNDLASVGIKDTVYNYDNVLDGGRRLFIVEGPFDALKLDFYGKWLGCRAVALYNMNMEDSQLSLLGELVTDFKEVQIVLDRGMLVEGKEILDQLMPFVRTGGRYFSLPMVKDPGELTPKQVEDLCSK